MYFSYFTEYWVDYGYIDVYSISLAIHSHYLLDNIFAYLQRISLFSYIYHSFFNWILSNNTKK